MQRDIRTESHQRTININRAAIDIESRTIPASLSSETAVERWFGMEVLSHDEGAVDLSRASDGLPLLWNHDSDKPIGIVESVRLDHGVLRGILRFSRNKRAEEVWQDVQDGMLRNISIGYSIQEWVESKDTDLIRVIKWSIAEASIAPVPADPTVGINRAFKSKESTMPVEAVVPESAAPLPVLTELCSSERAMPLIDINAIRRDLDITRQSATSAAIMAERNRVNEVSSIFDLPHLPRNAEFSAIRARALQDGWSADQTRKIILDALGTEPATDHRAMNDEVMGLPHPEKSANQQSRASTTVDALDKFKVGVADALAVRAGLDSSKESVNRARAGGFIGVRLSRMAESYLQLAGMDTRGLSDDEISKRAMSHRASGMTTSDFTNLLVNTANKALLLGWEQAPETWQQWVRIGQVPDFKSATRTGLSGFSTLAVVPEDGEIAYGKFTDRKETIQAVSYAKKFRLTYQAIKNDDLNAFTTIPRGMGRAAQSVIGDIVYNLLSSTGPTLNQDSTALFEASSHKNYATGAGAPSTTTFDTAFVAMAKQTDPNSGKALNIAPRYFLVPKAIETTGRILVTSQYDPAAVYNSKNFMAPNPFVGRVELISDARLDALSTTAWYLLADPNRFDTVEVAFVDGIAEPYLREETEWDTRGVEWVVGVDFGVAALDFRGMYKHAGA